MKILVAGLCIGCLLIACKKPSEIIPVAGWTFATRNNFTTGTVAGSSFDKVLVTTITSDFQSYLDTLRLPSVSTDNPFVSAVNTASTVVQRDGTRPFPRIGPISGTPIGNVPIGLLQLVTQGNKPLASISASDSIRGWFPVLVNYINTDGSLENITNLLNNDLVQSLSMAFVFFPDGYYLFINLSNPNLNSYGVYQIALTADNLPLGIVYRALASGPSFTDPPLNQPPLNQTWQGFGVWGLAPNRFFPAVLINAIPRIDAVVLTMAPRTF